jgi:uncharacterized membrane protein
MLLALVFILLLFALFGGIFIHPLLFAVILVALVVFLASRRGGVVP